MTSRVIAIGFLLSLLFSPGATAQISPDRVVVPGERVGTWSLGLTIPDLLRVNGPPGARPSIISALVPKAVWYSWDSVSLAAGTHDRRRTQYLGVYRDRDFITPKGVGLGSRKRAVLAAHGEPALEGDIFVQGKIYTVLAYNKIGLALFMHEDVVQVVLVFRPGEMEELLVACEG